MYILCRRSFEYKFQLIELDLRDNARIDGDENVIMLKGWKKQEWLLGGGIVIRYTVNPPQW